MRIHELKTWPHPFQAVLDGIKRHEIRVNDRNFACGDVLHLREWNYRDSEFAPTATGATLIPVDSQHYTGRELWVDVTYFTPGGEWGIPDGMCVMSIAPRSRPGSGAADKPRSLLDWGSDGLYDDTRAIHLHGLCHGSSDGECSWRECPQRKKYRSHCPLDKGPR